MRKYINLLKYEFKTIIKDPTNAFMLIYPIIAVLMMGLLIPLVVEKVDNPQAAAITMLIVFGLAISIGSYVTGALLEFSLIDNKDEKTILNISVTPIRLSGYTLFKTIYTYVLAIIGNIVIIGGLKLIASDAYIIEFEGYTFSLLDNIKWIHIIVFAFVSSLLVPAVALVLASFAKNKVEGFAFVKSGGIFIFIPILSLLDVFRDAKQYILGIIPNFWPIKAMLNIARESNEPSDLNFYVYMLIGAVLLIIVSYLCLRMFIKRLNIN